jgi:hypothetical protein
MPPNKERRERSGEWQRREERREGREHVVHDVVSDTRENVKHLRPLSYRSRERYATFEVELHVHFSAWLVGSRTETEQFCAVYHRSRLPLPPKLEMGRTAESKASECEKGQMGDAVLVGVGKFIENPEFVAGRVVWPSLVRLQPLDFCLRALGNVPYHPLLARESLLAGGLLSNRELYPSRNIVRQRTTVLGDGERVDKAIKSRPEVVQAIPDDKTELNRGFSEGINPDAVLASLRVEFVDDAVRVSSQPPQDSGARVVRGLGKGGGRGA